MMNSQLYRIFVVYGGFSKTNFGLFPGHFFHWTDPDPDLDLDLDPVLCHVFVTHCKSNTNSVSRLLNLDKFIIYMQSRMRIYMLSKENDLILTRDTNSLLLLSLSNSI